MPSNPGSGKKPTLFPGVCRVRLKVGYLDGIPISQLHEVADCNRGRGGGWLWKGGGGVAQYSCSPPRQSETSRAF